MLCGKMFKSSVQKQKFNYIMQAIKKCKLRLCNIVFSFSFFFVEEQKQLLIYGHSNVQSYDYTAI